MISDLDISEETYKLVDVGIKGPNLLGRSTTGNDTPYQRYREIVTARSHIMPEDK
jgi:hypothetical protein